MTEDEAWEDLDNRLNKFMPNYSDSAIKAAKAIEAINAAIERIATLEDLIRAHKEIFITDGYVEAWAQAGEVLRGCLPPSDIVVTNLKTENAMLVALLEQQTKGCGIERDLLMKFKSLMKENTYLKGALNEMERRNTETSLRNI